MMGLSLADARTISLWEYSALLSVWNDRHAQPEEEVAQAPDAAMVARRMVRLEERGLAKSLH